MRRSIKSLPKATSGNKHPKFVLHGRQDAPEGTIGFVFDYYRKQGKIPDNILINSNHFSDVRN